MGGSTCTQRVLMAAIENNADFDIQTVDLRKGEHKTPAHLARQPFGELQSMGA
jgi:glutathione S-transferase